MPQTHGAQQTTGLPINLFKLYDQWSVYQSVYLYSHMNRLTFAYVKWVIVTKKKKQQQKLFQINICKISIFKILILCRVLNTFLIVAAVTMPVPLICMSSYMILMLLFLLLLLPISITGQMVLTEAFIGPMTTMEGVHKLYIKMYSYVNFCMIWGENVRMM